MIEAYFGLRHTLDIIMLCAGGVVICLGLIFVIWGLWEDLRKNHRKK